MEPSVNIINTNNTVNTNTVKNIDISPDNLVPKSISELTSEEQLNELRGDVTPITKSLISPNYKIKTSGWKLDSNGEVEFNQNLTRYAPTDIFFGTQNQIFDSYIRQMAFNSDWTRLYAGTIGGAKQISKFKNPTGDKTSSYFYVGALGTTEDLKYIGFNTGSDSFFCGSSAGTKVWLITNSDSPSETDCTISGTTFSNIKGVSCDDIYIYVLDGGTTSVKRFTVSGSTLTYVDTITLDNGDAKEYLAIDSKYIYSFKPTTYTWYKFNKTTGVTVSSFDISAPASLEWFGGICVDPDEDLRVLHSMYNIDNTFGIAMLSKLKF